MVEITADEADRDFSRYREKAESEPVVITHNDKPSVVLISAREFDRLNGRGKQVLAAEEMPNWLVERLLNAKMDPEHDYLDNVKAPPGWDQSATPEP